MDELGQEHQGEVAEPDSEQQQNLDTVFSTFFERVEELPPISKPRSAKNYLQANRDKIIHALSKGYTYEDLAMLLHECGFSISASTLRRYIGAVKGRKGENFSPSASQSLALDSSGLKDLPSTDLATQQSDQPKLRPRRK